MLCWQVVVKYPFSYLQAGKHRPYDSLQIPAAFFLSPPGLKQTAAEYISGAQMLCQRAELPGLNWQIDHIPPKSHVPNVPQPAGNWKGTSLPLLEKVSLLDYVSTSLPPQYSMLSLPLRGFLSGCKNPALTHADTHPCSCLQFCSWSKMDHFPIICCNRPSNWLWPYTPWNK